MEHDSKRKINLTAIMKYIDPTCCVILTVLQILVCTQHFNVNWNMPYAVPLFIALLVVSILLVISSILKCFVNKAFKTRLTLHIFDCVFLFVVCLITGNYYLSTLYCIILTQFYIVSDGFKPKFALFITSCVLYVVSFVCGYLVNHLGAETAQVAIDIISGCVWGLVAMTVHFAVTAFLLSYYNKNLKLAQALEESEAMRAKLTETAVYEERNRIARDIHDNAGHSMTAVIMQTEAAKLLIDSDPQQAKTKIISANIQAKNALEQMRESVHLLAGRNSTQSIKGALEDIIAQTIDATDIKIRYDLDDVGFDDDAARFICNSAKECLANGIRHGKATAFYVELKEEDGLATFIVSDNGDGADNYEEGFGLKGIRTKCESLGGEVRFTCEKGEGFEVAITLPVRGNKGEVND